jgi:hypothetical protein
MSRIIVGVKDKIKQAIHNNNGLYEAIFANHQIKLERSGLICYCLEKTPPLYSNLVTVSVNWKPDDVFKCIDFNFDNENRERWSVKDSFGVLDLSQYGFTKLFDAPWFYLQAEKFKPARPSGKLRYEIVDAEDVLAAWRIAWDPVRELGKEIFNRKLLDDPQVYFVAGFDAKQILSGCLVNRTENVLGVSNFFAPGKDTECWSEAISFIFDSIERTSVVGYERKELTDKLQTLGFETVGDLTVWLKNRNF